MPDPERAPATDDRSRDAETVLRRLGFSRVEPARPVREPGASFWVQEAGVPRRTFPVFVPTAGRTSLTEGIDRWLERAAGGSGPIRRAIFVAGSDAAADEAWDRLARTGPTTGGADVSILVVPAERASERSGYFALRRIGPRELLRVATGVVVGLFRRTREEEGGGSIDFAEMLQLLRVRFGIDVHRSLGVRTDEDALYVLYQLAQRDTYAPGEAGANLHLLALKPMGPAARVPWFAA